MNILLENAIKNYGDLTPEQTYIINRSITDFIAVSVAGIEECPYKNLIKYLCSEHGGGIPTFNDDLTLNAENWALLYGTLGHAIDYDDISYSMVGHPSVVLSPTIFALGYETNSNGKQLVESYYAGLKFIVFLSRNVANSQYERGYHTTSTIGIFGSVVAASKLLNLDETKVENALGIAASFASGISANFGTSTKPLHAGMAAKNGIMAAKLAKMGFDSSQNAINSSKSIFSIYSDIDHLTQFDDYYDISEDIIIKPYPSCGFSLRSIDCAIKLRETIDINNIEKVNCKISMKTNNVLKYDKPKTGLEARFSLEYCVASALVNGQLKMKHFNDDYVNDSDDIKKLMNKVTRILPEGFKNLRYDEEMMEMQIITKNGDIYSETMRFPKGSPENPMNESEFKAKFYDCTENKWGENKRTVIFDHLMNLDKVDNVRNLIYNILK